MPPACPSVMFKGVPYTDHISHMRFSSVLGANPPVMSSLRRLPQAVLVDLQQLLSRPPHMVIVTLHQLLSRLSHALLVQMTPSTTPRTRAFPWRLGLVCMRPRLLLRAL